MLASVCIKYVHKYSFPSILNSARASYSRRHRLTDANTRILRSLGKVLTIKGMCVFALQDGVCRVSEEPFRCRDTGFPVAWERLFCGAGGWYSHDGSVRDVRRSGFYDGAEGMEVHDQTV